MAKAVFIYCRSLPVKGALKKKLEEVGNRLIPDGIETSERIVDGPSGLFAFYITDVSSGVVFDTNGVLLGCRYGEAIDGWSAVGGDQPNGNFAAFRADESGAEVLADSVASRTVWYYFDRQVFIASTSQRAIVMLKESFEFDEKTIPWMLSTGSLGPECSWDRDVRRVLPGGKIRLDKLAWSISVSSAANRFNTSADVHDAAKERLQSAITDAIGSADLPVPSLCAVPLSGGYDSRVLLKLLTQCRPEYGNVRTVTWGTQQSPYLTGSDAYVSQRVAAILSTEHRFIPVETNSVPPPTAVENFLTAGEGRIDQIAGYLDGFALWRNLRDSGVRTILRGDEGFGWQDVKSDQEARLSVGLGIFSDFANLSQITSRFNLPMQEIPQHLNRDSYESLASWRDRLYLDFRIPTVIASLADAKLAYLEQVTPFLSPTVLSIVKSLPDGCRTDKRLFKEIAKSIGPPVAYAVNGSTEPASAYLGSEGFANFLRNSTTSESFMQLFGHDFANFLNNSITYNTTWKVTRRWKSYAKIIAPSVLRSKIRRSSSRRNIHLNVIAFRAVIVVKMLEMLRDDSRALGRNA